MVTIAAPHHTITKTAANTKEAELPGAVALSVVDNIKHTKSGPHKSPVDTVKLLIPVHVLKSKSITFTEFL